MDRNNQALFTSNQRPVCFASGTKSTSGSFNGISGPTFDINDLLNEAGQHGEIITRFNADGTNDDLWQWSINQWSPAMAMATKNEDNNQDSSFSICFELSPNQFIAIKGPSATIEPLMNELANDGEYLVRSNPDGTEDALWKRQDDKWISLVAIAKTSEIKQNSSQVAITDDILYDYIESLCQSIGVKRFALGSRVDTAMDSNISEGTDDTYQSPKIMAAPTSRLAAKRIIDHAENLLNYVGGNAPSVDEGNNLKDNSLLLFFITESILFAHTQNGESNVIDLDCLSLFDSNHLLMENIMQKKPLSDGDIISNGLFDEQSKFVREMSSIQSAKALQLNGLSLIYGLGLERLSVSQRRLFIKDYTSEDVANIVARDIQYLTEHTLKSWSVEDNENQAFKYDVEQSLSRLYASALTSEYQLMREEFSVFSEQEKTDYKLMIDTQVDGNLIVRARGAIQAILSEANAQDALSATSESNARAASH